MSFRLGIRSTQELIGVHPDLCQIVEVAISLTSVDFGVHDGLRTPKEQEGLVEAGASRSMNSRHLKGGDGFGHAVDLVPYINGKLRWDWGPIYKIAEAVHLAAAQTGISIRWGGVWDRKLINLDPARLQWEVEQYGERRRALGKGVRVFIDGPHFELPISDYP